MIFIAAMTFFGLTVKISPGYMRGTSNVPFVRLVEKFEANLLCPKCEVICTAESRHCYICDQCVERFDHHCQWVDNCIGKENHSYFYIFIILQDLYLVIVVIMAILSKSSDKIASEFIHCFHSLYNIVCLFYWIDFDLVITDELLENSRETCLLPVLVLPNTVLA